MLPFNARVSRAIDGVSESVLRLVCVVRRAYGWATAVNFQVNRCQPELTNLFYILAEDCCIARKSERKQ
jgi:hypothetical protein